MPAEQDLHDVARVIAVATLGRDPGPMTTAASKSQHVYVGPDLVVKIIDVTGHSRLNREIALAPHLPTGLAAPLLASGLHRSGTRSVRYACYARVPGTTPGMDLPGVDAATARYLAEQAVQLLGTLHKWTPAGPAERTPAEAVDDGGFVSRAALLTEIDNLATLDRDGIVPRPVLDGLTVIAQRAPLRATATVPVHADCQWGNWLAHNRSVTALLDFEGARFGDPIDDWVFLAGFSGPHLHTVLDVISGATAISPEALWTQCEVREAAYRTSDLRDALKHSDTPAHAVADNLRDLDELIRGHRWWKTAR